LEVKILNLFGKKEGNSIVDIKKYLSTPEKPITNAEFTSFWNSLTEEEKQEFKKTELK
jgi:hypothetical protein